MSSLAVIHQFLQAPMTGQEIEERSFEIIDRKAPRHRFTSDQWAVVRRMIHTMGDFGILRDVRFSANAITSAIKALRKGCPIFTDSNMIRAGISIARLRKACRRYGARHLRCHVADTDVARKARQMGLPRSLLAARKARKIFHGGIALFGNAPVALLELNRMILEEKIRPALVVAMPVGFVHVVESKRELMRLGVPYIALKGNRGGSPLAVSVLHALCELAAGRGRC